MRVILNWIRRVNTQGGNPIGDGRTDMREQSLEAGTNGEISGTSGDTTVSTARRLPLRAVHGLLLGLLALSAVVDTFSTLYVLQRLGSAQEIWHPILWSASSVLVIALLLPFIAFSSGRIRALWKRPLISATVACAALVTFAAIHIGGMVALRDLAYLAAGEHYDFPWTWGQVFYEFRKDALTFALFTAVYVLNEWPSTHHPASHGRPQANGATPRQGDQATRDLWLRDGAASLRIEPAQVAWVGSAGNYVEYVLADGKRHLIRGTLNAEEARLVPLGIVRIHRTRLINLKRAVSITPRSSGDVDVRLDTGEVVVCSRRYRDRVREAIGS
jgi:hypothetical protein